MNTIRGFLIDALGAVPLSDYTQDLVGAYKRSYEAEAEIENLRDLTREILDHFSYKGHPGRPCLRTDWVAVEQVEKWRAALDRKVSS